MSDERRPLEQRIAFAAIVALALFAILFPFYWIFITSIKTKCVIFQADKITIVPTRPEQVTLDSYRTVFERQPFHLYLRNSFCVALLTTFFCLLVGSLCAYATARLEFPGKSLVLGAVLAVSMFPPIAVVSPLFLVLKKLNLLNTYAGLVLPYTCFGLPLTIWTLHSFFKDLPGELLESARVDGCTIFGAFYRIVLPLALPGLFTCAILTFIAAWNEFLFALVFVTNNSLKTVPVGITLYPGQFEMPWGTIFAAATLVTLPLVIIVFLFQRYIISGLTAGAVKG